MLDVISLSGSVIAKMVAARPPELRNRALRPAQPHWYGTITAGHRQQHRGDRAALSDAVSLTGRARLGPVTGYYRAACAVLETPVNALEPEFVTRTGRPGAAMLLREYLCPVSGLRLGTEIIRSGDDLAADMALTG